MIVAGDPSTQLTWMDAKRDGVVFTPRYGKAVEINALWHHGLLSVAGARGKGDPGKAAGVRGIPRPDPHAVVGGENLAPPP